jgi:hypothetical protein
MATETKDGAKRFGSAYKAKRYDSYHDGEQKFDSYSPDGQPGDNENEHSTPQEHTGDKVNTSGPDKVEKNPTSESVHAETPSSHVESHGPAHTVHYSHNHDGNKHTVTSLHPDGSHYSSEHDNARDAYQAGGELSATDVKKREHPDQQGAESEERNYMMPDLA